MEYILLYTIIKNHITFHYKNVLDASFILLFLLISFIYLLYISYEIFLSAL